MQYYKVRGCCFEVPQKFPQALVWVQADEQVETECLLKQWTTGFSDSREEFLCRSEVPKVPIEVVDQRIARTVALRALWTVPSDKPFVPSPTWKGSFQGWIFQTGPESLGYHADFGVEGALREPMESITSPRSQNVWSKAKRKRGGQSHHPRCPP